MAQSSELCHEDLVSKSDDYSNVTSTLEDLQTDEQRRVLDVVSRIRKFGLNTFLDLPQSVVCGDQSSGKSSVLEALTRIRFPTSDNLCTRFATEINLRREAEESLSVRIVPHERREDDEKSKANAFHEKISDLDELPSVMEKAKQIMGIDTSGSATSAFSLDVLSIDIAGPERPQLSLVDIPGLIQSSTKGVSEKDVKTVGEITDRYISRSRTICLAVISATNDAANQGILQRVRQFDPKGSRTLGVITKVDLLPDGSGSQTKFIQLALNEDVCFDLGWHVIRNRKFEESGSSFAERDEKEKDFFLTSPFGALNDRTVGIDALRARLSQLLFEHIRTELPKLLVDTDRRLQCDEGNLELLGNSRASLEECRRYFTHLCMDCHDITKSALVGVYHHAYFKSELAQASPQAPNSSDRLRATLQNSNAEFSNDFHAFGHKYQFPSDPRPGNVKAISSTSSNKAQQVSSQKRPVAHRTPKVLTETEALEWVEQMLKRSRGTELAGNFNPHLVAELFWEQSEKWRKFGLEHIDLVNRICARFFADLVERKVPKDVRHRFRVAMIDPVLKKRREAAVEELDKLIKDRDGFPINYNDYYIETIRKSREARLTEKLKSDFSGKFSANGSHWGGSIAQWVGTCIEGFSGETEADMNRFSCKEALDCLTAIYKVQRKTFVANVTTQVVERQMLRGLADLFSPLVVSQMEGSVIEKIVAEQNNLTKQRAFLSSRVAKLRECREELKTALANPDLE